MRSLTRSWFVVTLLLAPWVLAGEEVLAPFFGNRACPVSGEEHVDRKSFTVVDGQKVYYCCNDCKPEGEKDPKGILAKAYPASSVKEVKNEKCPVSGRPVAADSTVVFQGRKVAFCCGKCPKKFLERPVSFLVQLENPGAEDLKNQSCPVSQKTAGDDDVVIYKKKIVHLCTPDCVERFKKDPDKYLAAASGKD